MIIAREQFRDLDALLAAVCDQTASPQDLRRIEYLACDDDGINRVLDYLQLDGLLRWEYGLGAAGTGEAGAQFGEPASDVPTSTSASGDVQSANGGLLPPPIIVETFPAPQTPWFSLQSPLGAGVFSYFAAVLIMGAALLGAWAYKITHYRQIVDNRPPPINRPEMQFVGQITGMVDCRWSDPRTETYPGASAPLGRQYALSSGLMEITYDSGAKVILQGPCTYTVEARAGGFLSLGKLTATVVSGQWPVASAKQKALNPKSPNLQISKSPNHSPLSPFPTPLFFVRTPTAIVTDLGTEFGVEVGKEGQTTSYVFRGLVQVRLVGDGPQENVVLRAGESARVEKGEDAGSAKLIVGGEVGDPPKFVRRLVEPPKLLDLLDIVAGGNGLGNRRERGIDPLSGMEAPFFIAEHRRNVTQYQRVTWHRLIDGVFVPDGRRGPIQLDSAGHKFDGFPPTWGSTFGSIWARAADMEHDERTKISREWIYSAGEAGKYMPQRRGLLGMHSNVGITFDLAAVRRAHPGFTPTNFRAVAGLADKPGSPSELEKTWVDVWVFIDGRLTFKRNKLHVDDGVFNIDVILGPGDRFLTLAVTDFDQKTSGDRMIFGDPVLEMVSAESEN